LLAAINTQVTEMATVAIRWSAVNGGRRERSRRPRHQRHRVL